jgi:hypothetical protein
MILSKEEADYIERAYWKFIRNMIFETEKKMKAKSNG